MNHTLLLRRYGLLALLLTALGAPGALAQTCSTEWAAPVDGAWESANNWTGNEVPGPGDVACITASGTYTVALGGFVGTEVATLVVGGASGTQTLTSQGFITAGSAQIRPNGRLQFIDITPGGADGLYSTGTILVEGEVVVPGGVTFLANAGTLDIAPSGTFRVADAGSVGGTSSLFRVRGTIEGVDCPFPISSGSCIVQAPVEVLGGTLRAASGVLQFQAGGTMNGATLDAGPTSLLLLNADFVEPHQMTVEGLIQGTPQGTVGMTRVSFAAGPAGATLAVGGTGLQMVGTSFLTSAGGSFTNTGLLLKAATGSNFSGISDGIVRNTGVIEIPSSLGLYAGGVLRNESGGVVRATASGSLSGNCNGTGRFENAGLFVLDAPGGSFGFDDGGCGNNSGPFSEPGSEIRVLAGTLDFLGPASRNLPEGTTLTGFGGVRLPGTLFVEGTVSPGTEAEPIGTLQPVSTFRFAPQARTVVDVAAGGVSDRLGDVDFNGFSYTLGGTLVVRIRPGYTPAVGDAFTFIRNGVGVVGGAFDTIEVEGGPPGLSFAVDTSNPGSAVLRAVIAVSVEAPVASVAEGTPASFVLRHPASATPFSVNLETGGTATLFADYTLGLTRGVARVLANTTQTVVQLFPRRDANDAEGTETVTLSVLLGNGSGPGTNPEAAISIVDGSSSADLSLTGIFPATGSTLGTVTPTVSGTGFRDNTTISLVGAGNVSGQRVAIDPTGSGASATFDLSIAPVGIYDVVVESGGQTATLPGAFNVVEGQVGVPVWADVSGTSSPRFGRWSTYTLTVGNDADADIYDTFAVIRLPAGVEYEVGGLIQPMDLPAGVEDYVGFDVGTAIVIPIYFYNLPARATRSLEIRVRPVAPIEVGDGIGVSYELYPPNPFASFTYSGDFADFDADLAAEVVTNWGVIGGALEVALREMGGEPRTADAVAATLGRLGGECPNNKYNRDIREESGKDLIEEYSTASFFNQNRGEIAANAPSPLGELVGFGLGVVLTAAAAAAGSVPVFVAAAIATFTLGIASLVTAGQSASRISASRGNFRGGEPWGSERMRSGDGGESTGGAGGGPAGGIGGGPCGPTGSSRDPNDKRGPEGAGVEHFYDPATVPTPYVVRFENLETATFPAQEVVVVDTLDTAVFDLSTFSLGPIRWGNGGVAIPPPGAKTYETVVDLAPGLNATLLITAALDEVGGRVVWHFATLDPATGDLPEDGTVGFLPPNMTAPEGEGSVSFSVSLRESRPTGTLVENRAEIVFDINDPIVTPTWTNIVDVSAPVSSVEPLGTTTSNPISISVAADDIGAGVYIYQLFASRDGGAFELVAQSAEPIFEFEGEVGSTYGFYSITLDYVLNVEGPKTEAEATTAVAVSVEGGDALPREVTLTQPYPNPARGIATLRWGLPRAAHVTIRVYDLLGREVARLADEEPTEAGWHTGTVNAVQLASGIYVVRLRADEIQQTRRIVVVH